MFHGYPPTGMSSQNYEYPMGSASSLAAFNEQGVDWMSMPSHANSQWMDIQEIALTVNSCSRYLDKVLDYRPSRVGEDMQLYERNAY
jgi:hypothetical protein